jgi:hypothetical protein
MSIDIRKSMFLRFCILVAVVTAITFAAESVAILGIRLFAPPSGNWPDNFSLGDGAFGSRRAIARKRRIDLRKAKIPTPPRSRSFSNAN